MAETPNERLLEVTIYNLHLMCLVGYPAPKVKRLDDRMRAPRAGDLVLEVSTIYWEERAGTRLGRLERMTREPVFTPEEWAQGGGGDDPIPTEDIWYLTLADGREYRWNNATFIAVPTAIDRHDVEFISEPAAFGIPLATPPTAAPPETPTCGTCGKLESEHIKCGPHLYCHKFTWELRGEDGVAEFVAARPESESLRCLQCGRSGQPVIAVLGGYVCFDVYGCKRHTPSPSAPTTAEGETAGHMTREERREFDARVWADAEPVAIVPTASIETLAHEVENCAAILVNLGYAIAAERLTGALRASRGAGATP